MGDGRLEQNEDNGDTDLPLAGMRVVDLTRNVAGPYATMILGELGADVVKIERPGAGDDTRGWGPPFWNGESAIYLALNRNKRALQLDLKRPESRPVLDRLVAQSDIVVESFRPTTLERLGFGFDWAISKNPKILYCSVTSFGRTGPRQEERGYDPIIQAFGGIMSVTGEPGRPPVRVGTSIIDMGTGMWAALAILAAAKRCDRTGVGEQITVSLYETALAWMSYHLGGYWASGVAPTKHGSGMASMAPYGAFQTTDGCLVVAAPNDGLFLRFCQALELDDAIEDPRFRTNADRVHNRDALQAVLEEATCLHSTAELGAKLDSLGIPNSPPMTVDQVAEDPQARALGIFQTASHPTVGTLKSVGLPFEFGGVRPQLRRVPPQAGQHGAEVLGELGFSIEEIAGILEENRTSS